MGDPFQLVAAILAVAAVVGFAAVRLRQPLLVAFIAVGILVGPSVLGWVDKSEPLELFAEIGIAVLLFLVGLKLDIGLVRRNGKVAALTGLGQVAFTSIVGFGIALLLGFDVVPALYIAIALTFSSTIIIVKLLSDKKELEELHGRIALGFLIVQDIVVVVVMIALSTFGGGTGNGLGVELGLVVAKGAALAAGLAVMMRWVLPWVLHRVAASQELLLVAVVAWAVSLAALGDRLGFSIEVGAFLAGFALASTPFRDAIGSSLTPLRDFLLLFFFIELGLGFDFSASGGQVGPAIVFSLFVLIGNPLIVLVIMGVMGYRKRVGFLAGLTVAQISEFSLIFVILGRQLGHIDDSVVGLVTLVGVITIGLSTYLILYSKQIYERIAPALSIFERAVPAVEPDGDDAVTPDVIVYGYGRFGQELSHRLVDVGVRVIVVTWDPQAVMNDPDREGIEVVFGDAANAAFPETLPLAHVGAIVSTIPEVPTNLALLASLRRHGYDGVFAATVHVVADAEVLAAAGTDIVLKPFADAANQAADRVVGWLDLDEGVARAP